jgi:hypothetical protein
MIDVTADIFLGLWEGTEYRYDECRFTADGHSEMLK